MGDVVIRLYNSAKYFDASNLLWDNENFFNVNVSAFDLTDECIDAMLSIDKATILDQRTQTITTPFGVTDLNNLSTGCKTVINYMYLSRNKERYPQVQALNVSECGWQALDVLFSYIEKTSAEIALVLEHTNDIFRCGDHNYLVNGKKLIRSMCEYELEEV